MTRRTQKMRWGAALLGLFGVGTVVAIRKAHATPRTAWREGKRPASTGRAGARIDPSGQTVVVYDYDSFLTAAQEVGIDLRTTDGQDIAVEVLGALFPDVIWPPDPGFTIRFTQYEPDWIFPAADLTWERFVGYIDQGLFQQA